MPNIMQLDMNAWLISLGGLPFSEEKERSGWGERGGVGDRLVGARRSEGKLWS